MVKQHGPNALQKAPSNGVGCLCDYAHVRVSQWPMGSPCLLTAQFVKNETVSTQFSSVQFRRCVRAFILRWTENCINVGPPIFEWCNQGWRWLSPLCMPLQLSMLLCHRP